MHNYGAAFILVIVVMLMALYGLVGYIGIEISDLRDRVEVLEGAD